MFYIYRCALKPILTYASDVWGVFQKGRDNADKFYTGESLMCIYDIY